MWSASNASSSYPRLDSFRTMAALPSGFERLVLKATQRTLVVESAPEEQPMQRLLVALVVFGAFAFAEGQGVPNGKFLPIAFDDWWNIDYVKNGCEMAAPNRETKEARGGGSCTGPVEVNRGPL
jgi:hypothetical protein